MLISPISLGISGGSGTGKTRLDKLIIDVIGKENIVEIGGDDFHKWERGDPHWEKFTHLNPDANRLFEEESALKKLESLEPVKVRHYSHKTGKFTPPEKIEPKKLVLVSGLHSYSLAPMRGLIEVKVFLEPDERLRRHWKIVRDKTKRGWKTEQILDFIEKRIPDYKKYVCPQKKYSDIVIKIKPKNRIKNLGDENEKLDLLIEIKAKRNKDVEKLCSYLKGVEGLKCRKLKNKSGPRKVTYEYESDISSKEVEACVNKIMPDLRKKITKNPKWSSGYDGIYQLFIFLFLNKYLKA